MFSVLCWSTMCPYEIDCPIVIFEGFKTSFIYFWVLLNFLRPPRYTLYAILPLSNFQVFLLHYANLV